MNKIKIITEDYILRQISKDTSIKEVEDLGLVLKLKEAIKTSWTTGLGLAAIQIGIPLRMAWYIIPKKKLDVVMINPVIMKLVDYMPFQGEGCLSIPDKRFNTGRYNEAVVKGTFIINGTVNKDLITCVSGLEAAIIQHETDHMDGILCKDKNREYKQIKKPRRNDKCLCGSGLKYKKCCIDK